MKKFFKENWVEIVTVIAILLGILAVMNRNLLRHFFDQRLPALVNTLTNLISKVIDRVSNFFMKLSQVELAVYGLAVVGVLFILFRIRYRFLASQRWRSSACPRCGSELHRIHRSSFDRLLGKILLPNARRYLCQNTECGWTGLKNIERRKKSRRTDIDTFSFDSQE